ncbi:DUF305 domain-containing protein [Micromonospora avicenniae]|uniref:DUF305 domain-containing protein n=1 Tax=Micromonospora avicenniae TaxID=1198245 RepID=UPI00332F93F7
MTVRRARVLAAVTLALALPLVAVVFVVARDGSGSASTRPAAAPASATPGSPGPSEVTVVVPGRPGEPAATRRAGEVRGAGSTPHNEMDVWFVRMMIPHHMQALEMSRLAPDRAADPTVRAIADRIRATQDPEIGLMRAWLQNRGLSVDVAGHDHGSMRGMQTPEAMRQLAAARGAEFDRLFVKMMTEHHEGAIEMATNLLTVGADQQLNEFADSVATEQTVEIDRMRELLAG